MRTIIVGFSKSTIPFPIGSKAIMWYEGTDFSHCYVEYSTAIHLGDDTIYHSARGMVHNVAKKNFLKKNEVIAAFEITLPDELYVEIRNSLHATTGVDYGTMQNVGIPISDLFDIDNPWKKGYNCSELIYEKVLDKMLDDLYYNKDRVKPSDIFDILEENIGENIKRVI